MPLRRFECVNCRLSGPLPAWGHLSMCLNASSSMEVFNVSYNSFSGPIPTRYGSWPTLSLLDVSHNNLSGGLNGTAPCLPMQLQQLRAAYNNFTGIPDGDWFAVHIRHMPSLSSLFCHQCCALPFFVQLCSIARMFLWARSGARARLLFLGVHRWQQHPVTWNALTQSIIGVGHLSSFAVLYPTQVSIQQ